MIYDFQQIQGGQQILSEAKLLAILNQLETNPGLPRIPKLEAPDRL
jgi:hypothetical protein